VDRWVRSTMRRSFSETRVLAMEEKPRLILAKWTKGVALLYECSECGTSFELSEKATPVEGAKALWKTFTDHVENQHPGHILDS